MWDVTPAGSDEETALKGVECYKEFMHSIGMPTTFKELGIENPDIDLLHKKLHEDKGETVGNYVKLDRKATREIYELAL